MNILEPTYFLMAGVESISVHFNINIVCSHNRIGNGLDNTEQMF